MKPLLWCCGAFAALVAVCLCYALAASSGSVRWIEHYSSTGGETYVVLYRNGDVDQFETARAGGAVRRIKKSWRYADSRDALFLGQTGAGKVSDYLVITAPPQFANPRDLGTFEQIGTFHYPSESELKAIEDCRQKAGN